MSRYIPKKGDLITVSFDPQTGREQKGRRPALVVSNDLFNRHTGLAIICPITNTDRGFPFHLAVPSASSLTGFVMVEQVKSVDYAMRGAKFVERAPREFVEDVLNLIDACIG
ncbi:MAG TPA: type II toxin-antitoxin system PemK/MazF family toxin [Blastocatellia bacterium]|nr:type II toxin-antitoxin system PemK/MazF family toxin [Blastocatellia bacterium]